MINAFIQNMYNGAVTELIIIAYQEMKHTAVAIGLAPG